MRERENGKFNVEERQRERERKKEENHLNEVISNVF